MNNNINKPELNLSELISRFKKEDSRYLKIFKGIRNIYICLIITHTLIFGTIYVSNHEINILLSGLSYIIGFTLFIYLFNGYYKATKAIDYTLPTLQLLKNTAKRYQLKVKKIKLVFLPLFFIEAGLTFQFTTFPINSTSISTIINIQIIYILIIIIATLIGINIWYKKHKPIRDNALALIKELEN